jgi:serine/threonine protein kinase
VTDQKTLVRVGRALASPVGVLVTLPLLVVAVGLGVLLVGRDATLNASDHMARRQLGEQATDVTEDVALALDAADPLLASLRPLSEREHSLDDTLLQMHDLMVGRPGVAFLSISFADGTFRGARLAPDGTIELQESKPGEVHKYLKRGNEVKLVATEPTPYDPREREFYKRAIAANARVWTDPYTFYLSHETGITCAEPAGNGTVLTVDFHVGALSTLVARPALDQARSIVYAKDGVVLAYPSTKTPQGDRLLRFSDLHDPALDALFAVPAPDRLKFAELDTRDGAYLAAIAPIGGKRAGVAVPLDWYVATLVPSRTLLGPAQSMVRSSLFASGGALAIAVGIALVLAWNLVRMRRMVKASREEARTAQERAKELGSYRLVARLGKGGMGEVWRAEHRLLARSAAIKVIRQEALEDPDAIDEIRERFRREAQTLASMKSRHTIAIFDYGMTAEGTFYYVMELLDGMDLEKLVVRYGPQPAARVVKILEQCCASLAEAHDAGLLHRDIKPPNLFICRAADEVDVMKLLDFGIVLTASDVQTGKAKAVAKEMGETPRLTQMGALLGTPGFMAPEQIVGMQLDGRADIYALGCVAWWLLTGGEVFSREGGEGKLLRSHMYEDVPVLKTATWLPDALAQVVRDCLAKEPEQRPADARALAKRLREIEIPDQHAWTAWRAAAWWKSWQPPAPAPSVPSEEVQVLVPRKSEREISPKAPAEAVTMLEPIKR